MESQSFIIIDHGSVYLKIGLDNYTQPLIIPSLSGSKRKTVGNRLMNAMMPKKNDPSGIIYGHEALSQSSLLRMDSTIDDRTNIKEVSRGLYIEAFKSLNLWDSDSQTIKDKYKY